MKTDDDSNTIELYVGDFEFESRRPARMTDGSLRRKERSLLPLIGSVL
jgi:hypothetical protein